MKRRIFSVLLSSALLLTALAGCGQGGEADPSGSPSDAESETATRDELIFVNYRDIRDLNPTCTPVRCTPRVSFTIHW